MKLSLFLVILLGCMALSFGDSSCKKMKQWCDQGLTQKVLGEYYLTSGQGPSANFTGVYPYLAPDVILQTIDVFIFPGRDFVVQTLNSYSSSQSYFTESLNTAASFYSSAYNEDQCFCGAWGLTNRTLVHFPTIKPVWENDVVVQTEFLQHMWREKPCTDIPDQDRDAADKPKLCMELFLMRELPNGVGLTPFFQPVFTWNGTQMCQAVSEVCDPIGANPFGSLSNCYDYVADIPMYPPTPCGLPGKINLLGNGVACRNYLIIRGYETKLQDNLPALQGICASVGPQGSPYAVCTNFTIPLMDPQCATYLPPQCCT